MAAHRSKLGAETPDERPRHDGQPVSRIEWDKLNESLTAELYYQPSVSLKRQTTSDADRIRTAIEEKLHSPGCPLDAQITVAYNNPMALVSCTESETLASWQTKDTLQKAISHFSSMCAAVTVTHDGLIPRFRRRPALWRLEWSKPSQRGAGGKVNDSYTWEQTIDWLRKAANQMEEQNFEPTVVLAVSDGLIPAAILCTNYGISECYFWHMPIVKTEIHPTRQQSDRPPHIQPELFENKEVLIMDHHMCTGTNLETAANFVRQYAKSCKTMVLVKLAAQTQRIEPDFFAFDEPSGKVKHMPWAITERHFEAYRS